MQMKESEVFTQFLARTDNYGVSNVSHLYGRLYNIVMNGEHHSAVVLIHSFNFYKLRYHLAPEQKPSMVICFMHDTVLPVPVLSMRAGNYAQAYELPEGISDMEGQRHSKLGSQVLLGAYISGVRLAQTIVNSLPHATRARYLLRAKELCTRKRGRPVGLAKKAS